MYSVSSRRATSDQADRLFLAEEGYTAPAGWAATSNSRRRESSLVDLRAQCASSPWGLLTQKESPCISLQMFADSRSQQVGVVPEVNVLKPIRRRFGGWSRGKLFRSRSRLHWLGWELGCTFRETCRYPSHVFT